MTSPNGSFLAQVENAYRKITLQSLQESKIKLLTAKQELHQLNQTIDKLSSVEFKRLRAHRTGLILKIGRLEIQVLCLATELNLKRI